jgi:hypothetical protein
MISKKKISLILRKFCPFRYRKPPGYQTNFTKTKPPTQHIIMQTTGIENRERILKVVREQKQVTFKVSLSK